MSAVVNVRGGRHEAREIVKERCTLGRHLQGDENTAAGDQHVEQPETYVVQPDAALEG